MEACKSQRLLLLMPLFFLMLLFLGIITVRAESEVKGGTTVVVTAGKTVTDNGTVTVNSGGTINNNGSMVIRGNLVNQNATNSLLGPGTFEFAGNMAQTISGPNEFTTLRIANTGTGVTIASGDQVVSGALKLKSGFLILGDNNLLLGPAATDSGGSSSSMVIATGAGELQKEFSGASAFTYPVGDNTGTADYSPVTLDFVSGTFPEGNFIGVKLEDAAASDAGITTATHITRNWTLSNNASVPITGFSCTGSFRYVPADVELMGGAESDLYLLKVSPLVSYNPTNTVTHTLSGTLNSFSTFTGGKAGLEVSFTAFLQGPYSTVGHQMNNTLATILPLGSRTDPTKFPSAQPYNGSPWNYSGTENVTSLPAEIVDWILIELRQAGTPENATSATIIATRAAFLKKDGSIVDIDGSSPIKFYNTSVSSNLYPVLRHRNHMATMASNTGASRNSEGTFVYDFASASTQIFGGTNGTIQLEASPERWGLMSGDANADNRIYLDDINTYWVPNSGLTSVYTLGDFSLDGNVYLDDFNTLWVPGSGKTNFLP